MQIEVIRGDITEVVADAIVNAANTSLLGGGGVDGAIHRKGGNGILEDCKAIRNRQGGCAVGEAVITTAGLLPAKHVIHTVGPVWQGGSSGEPEKLKSCYISSLDLAEANQLASIAFPNISTGIYRYPKDLAAQTAVAAVSTFKTNCIAKVTFVCFDEENFNLYVNIL